jgi:cob(I)alamin adenosyltransferase
MRKVEIIKSDLARVQHKVVELEAELKAAEEFEQQQAAEKTETYVERFNAERNKTAASPF